MILLLTTSDLIGPFNEIIHVLCNFKFPRSLLSIVFFSLSITIRDVHLEEGGINSIYNLKIIQPFNYIR